ncbi:MAG: radical SAM protein [bacterium]
MSNILFTNYCNNNCAYCFADGKMNQKKENLSFDNLVNILDFHEKSGIYAISILGGEPTLHPCFPNMLGFISKRKFHIALFTNGIIPEKSIDALMHLPKESINIIININEKINYPYKNWKLLQENLEKIHEKASLSFNLYNIDFDYRFPVDIVRGFNLIKKIRLGIAQPLLDGKNTFISEEGFPVLSQKILKLLEYADNYNIKVGFDCGFSFCMFDDEQIKELYSFGAVAPFKCGPAIDIGTDLSVWPCFPLYKIASKRLPDFKNIQEIKDHFEKILYRTKDKIIPSKCRSCDYFQNKLCSGGCLARIINLQ